MDVAYMKHKKCFQPENGKLELSTEFRKGDLVDIKS